MSLVYPIVLSFLFQWVSFCGVIQVNIGQGYDTVQGFLASDMLQTWRLNSKGQNDIHQRQAFDPETARPVVQQACNSCRVKKLRCSGERSGCRRCKTLSQDCVYAQNHTRGSARVRKKSTSKADGETRRSSISAPPAPAPLPSIVTTEIKAETPSQTFVPVCNAPNSESHAGPVSGPGTMISLEANMMLHEHPEYSQMMPMTHFSDLDTYQNSDGCLFSQPDFMQDSDLSFAKVPWEGWEGLPLPLLSRGGEELGMHCCDESPLTPTTSNLIPEPIITDMQTTPLSMNPQTVLSQHGSDDYHWIHSQTPEPCQCLQRVVFLLEEVDSEAVGSNAKELGSWLSRHKEALRCGEALLMCPRCQAKPEHMTILAFLTDRLIAMCDEMVSAYLLALAGNINNHNHNHNLSGAKDGAWLVWVGNFEIDSLQEWSALVSTMLAMQLRGLNSLMAKFKDLLRCVGGEGVRKKADSTQFRILALLEKLGPPQRDQNGFVLSPCGGSGPNADY
ncbi:hypothetical protein O1611_g6419 [Lasiodiplodia mahajangana]|uniref:Uncharacterized protein n=1 Tax=Lasiodiplodia mahajangana TaxID=1108764 RepID=A0ACC2JIA8_9PEZI|nr:hypothetical protein O1611_g6419 [Lasiodiplodia mahajangana]